jgi:hypothetical protein
MCFTTPRWTTSIALDAIALKHGFGQTREDGNMEVNQPLKAVYRKVQRFLAISCAFANPVIRISSLVALMGALMYGT